MSTVNLALQRIRRHTLMLRCGKLLVSSLVLVGLFLAAKHIGFVIGTETVLSRCRSSIPAFLS